MSDADLSSIRRNIGILTQNKKKIAHVVKESLTVINTTKTAVAENRVVINKILDQLKYFDSKMKQANDRAMQETMKVSILLQSYIKLDRLLAELTDFMHKAVTDMDMLQMQLNMLSLGHLSPSTIPPIEFRNLLLDIQSHLPFYLELPSDPEKNLWDFYNLLSCHTVLDGNKIYAVVSIPLLDANAKFEIFNVHNLPIHTNQSQSNSSNMIATFDLEASSIAINGDKTKYALLHNSEMKQCTKPFHKFCKLHSSIYPINVSKLCVIALFLNKSNDIENYCQKLVKPSTPLPLATYLYDGTWVISTITSLRFTVVCQDSNLRDSTQMVNPPLGVLKLGPSCTASNDYLYLPAFYHNESKYEISDPLDDLKISTNFTAEYWKPLIQKVPSFNLTKLPKHLKSLREIPIDNLIRELYTLDTVPVIQKRFPFWAYIIIILGVLLLTSLLICKYKSKLVRDCLMAKLLSSKLSSDTQTGRQKMTASPIPTSEVNAEPTAPLILSKNTLADNIYPKLDLSTFQ